MYRSGIFIWNIKHEGKVWDIANCSLPWLLELFQIAYEFTMNGFYRYMKQLAQVYFNIFIIIKVNSVSIVNKVSHIIEVCH